jgi:malonyl-CoA O-methyltransferase
MPTIKEKFNQAAETYHKYACIQKKMATELLQLTKKNSNIDPHQILDIGCGTGIATKLLQEYYPSAFISAMDVAPNMLLAAQKYLSSPKITFFLEDVESCNWKNYPQYDLMLSNAVFQWFRKPEATIFKLASKLQSNARLFVSTFGPSTFCELQSLFPKVEEQMGIPSYSHHLRMKEASFWQQLFIEANFLDVKVIEKKEKVFYPNCLTFLRAIKAIGASFSGSNHPLIVQKKLLQKVMKEYDASYTNGDHVYATYHVIYISGKMSNS